jgi:hypothetical protein
LTSARLTSFPISSTAQIGTAAALRFLAKQVMMGNDLSGIPDSKKKVKQQEAVAGKGGIGDARGL